MKKLFVVFVICSLFVSSYLNAQMIEHIYNFNNLSTTNFLNGVDDWLTVTNQSPSPHPDLDDWHLGYTNKWGVVSLDGSIYMSYDGEGTNVGRTASRLSTDSLPFDFSVGGIIEVQVDIKRGFWKTYFSFGYDDNDNGITLKGIENTLQFEPNDGGIGIHLSRGNPEYNVFVKPDGTYIPLNINTDSLLAYWYIYEMIIDLDANGGSGSITISYKKNGTGSWVTCSSVSGLDLGLTPGSGDRNDPAMWTKLLIHGTGLNCLDNIILRQPNTGGLQYQYLIFDPISDHLTTDPPFPVHAVSSLGLTPSYSIASGPATIAGDIITLTGDPGIVYVVASQAGNDTVAAAQNDTISFNVIDPYSVIPEIIIKNPVDTKDVNAPGLDPILLSVSTAIDYNNLISISEVYFTINTETIYAHPTNNGYYIAYWTPPDLGAFNMTATAVSEFDVSASETVSFNVVSNTASNTFTLIDHLHFATVGGSIDTIMALPSFSGTFNKVIASLEYDCPTGGCEPWDVTAAVYTTGANGEQIKLFTYITPYGVACEDSIDVSDLVSQLQGNIHVKMNFPNKSVITVKLNYFEGTPVHKFSWVEKLWGDTYQYGAITDLQPIPVVDIDLSYDNYHADPQLAFLREMTSGHGWGDLNTGNAAEFRESTHHFKVNGATEFTQHLWTTCNPNPVSCQPQNGTWFYNRSGWCPGSIPMLWRFDLSSRIGTAFELMYELDTTYRDYCSPYNPDCVTGVTCSDCDNMYNPNLKVAGEIITYFDDPPIPNWTPVSVNSPEYLNIRAYPNPSGGTFKLTSSNVFNKAVLVQISNITGVVVKQWYWNGEPEIVDISNVASGLYFIKVTNDKNLGVTKIIIQ